MRDVFICSDNIFSPIGDTSGENFASVSGGLSGIKLYDNHPISEQSFYASLFEENDRLNEITNNKLYTKFEGMLIASISDSLNQTRIDKSSPRTIFILSSTKGNINLLESAEDDEELREIISLHHSAKKIARYFGFSNQPVVISNACISGILAIITGMRMINSGQYDHAIVAGADVISKFVLSGFQSFQAVSNDLCKPFDEHRKGINLGEAAGTVILSADKTNSKGMKMSGGAVTNDANHISGPSRTGEELSMAILKAMKQANVTPEEIDLISAHGTATIYNDEMEAKAITLAGLQQTPVNSLKGYYGHTLGAAGIIESIISMYSIEENLIVPTMGFKKSGVSMPLNLSGNLKHQPVQKVIKTASGFGGCNAALVFSKQ